MPGSRRKDFFVETERLEKMVRGSLRGSVVVDQIYAQYQHEGLDLRHPRGGQAKYLEQPLLSNFRSYCKNIARTALKDGGVAGMVKSMEHLSGQVEQLAPVDLNNLRRSASPTVKAGSVEVYHRPPEQRRLTEQELAALRRREG